MTDRQEPLPPTIEVEGRDGVKHRVWDLSARQEAADTSGLRAGLVEFVLRPGFADSRPSGPRTAKGHALASSLRRRLADVDIDYDEWVRDIEVEAVSVALSQEPTPDERPLDVERHGDDIGRAMHEASQVGGPWTPCTVPYGQWPECEHQPMGRHVAVIIANARLSAAGEDRP